MGSIALLLKVAQSPCVKLILRDDATQPFLAELSGYVPNLWTQHFTLSPTEIATALHKESAKPNLSAIERMRVTAMLAGIDLANRDPCRCSGEKPPGGGF